MMAQEDSFLSSITVQLETPAVTGREFGENQVLGPTEP
jgi:hypothetical protein